MPAYQELPKLDDSIARQLETDYDACAVLICKKNGEIQPFGVSSEAKSTHEDVHLSDVDFADIRVLYSPNAGSSSAQAASASYCCMWVNIGGDRFYICWC